jgi:hypothetical protein
MLAYMATPRNQSMPGLTTIKYYGRDKIQIAHHVDAQFVGVVYLHARAVATSAIADIAVCMHCTDLLLWFEFRGH